MKNLRRQSGFSLTEMLVAVAILLVLMGALLAFGRHLRRQSQEALCRSTIDILVAALEQYYDFDRAFPAMNPPVLDPANPARSWRQRNENLYEQLYSVPRSRTLCEQIQKTLTGDTKELTGGVNGRMEFWDPWGTPLRYEYQPGWTFPVITSSGPDRGSGEETPPKTSPADDISSK